MASNHEHVRQALDTLTEVLRPYVERELEAAHGERWLELVRDSLPTQSGRVREDDLGRWDAHSLLTVVWEQWQPVFRHRLRSFERSLVSELRHYRNRWAHQDDFDFDDTYRILDDVQRLAVAVGSDRIGEVALQKERLLREQVGLVEPAEGTAASPVRVNPLEGLVFLVCGAALGFQIVQSFGSTAWPIALLAGVSFTYILFRRLALAQRTGGARHAPAERAEPAQTARPLEVAPPAPPPVPERGEPAESSRSA